MSKLAWFIPAGIVAGVLVTMAPSILTRLRTARRIARGLAVDRRAAEVLPEQIAAFDARHAPYAPGDVLDERTWDDLGLHDVFTRIDHCVSQPGRQVLYHMLRRPSLDRESIGAFDAIVTALQGDARMHASVRDAMAPLGGRGAAQLEAAFFGVLPARPALWWMFPLLTALSLVLLLLVFRWPEALVAWLVVCCINVAGQLVLRHRVREVVPALASMRVFVDVASRVGTLALPGLEPELATLRDGAARLRGMRTTTGWLRFDAAAANDLAGSMYEWGNMLFALDLSAFVLTITRLRDERAAGQAMFRALGRIDAMCSIATWRGQLGAWTTPRFTPAGKRLDTESLVHPLLDAGVPNDMRIDGTSVLVTGSNMSGKTTFLRALGVNAILAQSVGTVCARTWTAPVLHVRTSIGQGDSLLDGKSYYMAEIESVKRMLDAKSDVVPHLFLLDELFRGTNTPERIAAGAATLAWLDRGHDLVLVATHDLELHTMLHDRFVACHFREEVRDDALTFDFRIRPGLSSTRNAIALLRLTGFPGGLVDAAEAALASKDSASPAAGH
jgi:hypothetical protein